MIARVGRVVFALVLVAGAVSSVACGPTTVSCTTEARASFVVHVEDAKTSSAICDARVTASDASQTWTLHTYGPPDCSYTGVYEQPGTFQITVSKAGYQEDKTTVVVNSDTCHVITKDVSVKLSPQ